MSQESAGFSAPSVSSTFSWRRRRRRRRKANEGNKLVELFAFRANLINQHIFNRQDNSHLPHRTGRVGRALTHRFTFQGKETFASLYRYQQVNDPSRRRCWHVYTGNPHRKNKKKKNEGASFYKASLLVTVQLHCSNIDRKSKYSSSWDDRSRFGAR